MTHFSSQVIPLSSRPFRTLFLVLSFFRESHSLDNGNNPFLPLSPSHLYLPVILTCYFSLSTGWSPPPLVNQWELFTCQEKCYFPIGWFLTGMLTWLQVGRFTWGWKKRLSGNYFLKQFFCLLTLNCFNCFKNSTFFKWPQLPMMVRHEWVVTWDVRQCLPLSLIGMATVTGAIGLSLSHGDRHWPSYNLEQFSWRCQNNRNQVKEQ